MSRTLAIPALAGLVPLFLSSVGCLSTPEPVEVEVAAAEVAPPLPKETLTETYTRHVRELAEEDIALGRLVVTIGDSVRSADSAGAMLLRERTLERIVEQVTRLREARLRVLEFWDRVREQWPGMATMDERAALSLLETPPDRAE
jgi:hypothetical protein